MYICNTCCAQDAVADTPFHVAAKRGNVSVLRSFVENCTTATCSIIVRMVNHEGNTPLHAAAMNGHAEAAAVCSLRVHQSTFISVGGTDSLCVGSDMWLGVECLGQNAITTRPRQRTQGQISDTSSVKSFLHLSHV